MDLLVGLVGSAWCFCSYGSSRLPGHVLLMVIAETYEGKVNTPSTHQTFACIISTTMPVAKVSQPKVIVWGDTLQELRHIILPSLTSGEQKSKLFPRGYVGWIGKLERVNIYWKHSNLYTASSGNEKHNLQVEHWAWWWEVSA